MGAAAMSAAALSVATSGSTIAADWLALIQTPSSYGSDKTSADWSVAITTRLQCSEVLSKQDLIEPLEEARDG